MGWNLQRIFLGFQEDYSHTTSFESTQAKSTRYSRLS